jgi:hypothetical protein
MSAPQGFNLFKFRMMHDSIELRANFSVKLTDMKIQQ